MNIVVIYPGRFHPFHRGHKASYDQLVKQFGAGTVYIVSSDVHDNDKSPFTFDDKRKMMIKLGIPSDHIVQVKNPYQAREITSSILDPENTALIFAVSEKDMAGDDARFKFGLKKDGTPTYIQPMPDNVKKIKPMTKHAYLAITPTVNFRVRGQDANSASQVRKAYVEGNNADRESIIADLYGEAYPEIKDIFDARLGNNKPEEIVNYGAEKIYTGDNPVSVMREHRERLEQKIVELKQRIAKLRSRTPDPAPDYIEEKWSQKYKDSIDCSNPKGFSQRAHCAGRKKKVNESSGYSLAGSFTPDLTKSKVWLLDELSKIAPSVGTVYILGSWYGNLALYINLQPTFDYTNIINVEQDQSMLDQSARMLDLVGAKNVEHMLKDANDLDYRQLGNAGVVINCSLTDMDGADWFEHIPDGTLVVLQARDHDPGYQFHSPDDILDKFPLSQVLYSGTLALKDPETEYNRFMVIGRK